MHEYIAAGLPDLPKLLAPNRLSELRDMILLLDERLRSLLQSHNLHIAEFETPQQLELFLDRRG
jgi:hypothetical protein